MYLFSKYIYIYFIPTSMFTATSWVSHLLPPTSYPARTSLLVTTFLCQVGIFNSALQNTPNGDEGWLLRMYLFCVHFLFAFCFFLLITCLGMTSLEQWCFACITFTFMALLSYVLILVRLKRRNRNCVSTSTKEDAASTDEGNVDVQESTMELILFLCNVVSFTCFNLYFWTSNIYVL